jgi:4-hydroxybenzoyl-CoA thioesterase
MLYEAAGLPKPVMVEKFGIAGCPLVETRAKFMAPCRYGDDVLITSSIAEIRNSSFDIRHELSREGKLCVEGHETRVWTRKDPETGRLKSAPLPDEVVARFRGE